MLTDRVVQYRSMPMLCMLVNNFHMAISYSGLKYFVRNWEKVPLEYGTPQVCVWGGEGGGCSDQAGKT